MEVSHRLIGNAMLAACASISADVGLCDSGKSYHGYGRHARRDTREGYDTTPKGTLLRSQPRLGRNDPCPCGCGRKVKQCNAKAKGDE